MEMERINEDTIRVVVTNDDLAERDISVIELLGNQEAIERFFYSILEEVDATHDFEDNDAVTFQVLPNRNGLELFISKDLNEDNTMMTGILDSMFGKRDVSETNDDVSDALLEQLLDNDTDRPENKNSKSEDNVKRISEKIADSAQQLSEDLARRSQKPIDKELILQFTDFESIIQFSKILQDDAVIDTSLVEYKKNYFLKVMVDNTMTVNNMKDLTAVALEFGRLTPIAVEVLAEHGRTIFASQALEQVKSYFK